MVNIKTIKEVSIKNGEVCVNGFSVFSSDQTDTSLFLKELYKSLGVSYSKFYKMDTLSKLGFLAAELLVSDQSETINEDTAVVLANASSSLNTDVKYQASLSEIPSPALFVYTLPNIVIGEICIRHKIYGEQMFFIQPSYNRDMVMDYAAELFKSNITDNAIIGWSEVDMNGEYEVRFELIKNQGVE